MTALTLPAAFTPFAEPRRAVSARWIALFATAWLGIWMAQLTPIQLLLPQQIGELFLAISWVSSVVAFGIISGIAGACALIVFPLTGALSDHTTSRFGRRRPWIFNGTLVFAISLRVIPLRVPLPFLRPPSCSYTVVVRKTGGGRRGWGGGGGRGLSRGTGPAACGW